MMLSMIYPVVKTKRRDYLLRSGDRKKDLLENINVEEELFDRVEETIGKDMEKES